MSDEPTGTIADLYQHLIEHHGLTNSMVFTYRWCKDYHRRQHEDPTAEGLLHAHNEHGRVVSIHEQAQRHIDALRDLLAKMSAIGVGGREMDYSLGDQFDLTLAVMSAEVVRHKIGDDDG